MLALAAISGASGFNLLIPLYVAALGYPVAVVGLLAALAAVAGMLARLPVAKLYAPQHARRLLLGACAIGTVSGAALPIMPEIVSFTGVLLINRAVSGFAATVYLARYLDLLGEGTDRRRAMGNYGGTQALGFTCASLFVGLIADFFGFGVAFLYGAANALLAGLLLVGAPNPPARAARPAAAHEATVGGGWRRLLASVADPGLWGVVNANTWNNFLHTTQSSFFPVLGIAVGLGPAQIGIARAVYAAVNVVGRPTAGMVMGRFSLRQTAYFGLAVQAILLFLLPFVRELAVFIAIFMVGGVARAVVVVASSAGLAEDVDETKVSRGTATATFSTSSDIPHVVSPLAAGLIATAVGIGGMFSIVGVGVLVCFAAGDLAVQRWKRATAAAVAAKV
jgi:MFS family permease